MSKQTSSPCADEDTAFADHMLATLGRGDAWQDDFHKANSGIPYLYTYTGSMYGLILYLRISEFGLAAFLLKQSEATSVAELQKAAAAMVKESRGNCSSATKMMAKAGTSGKHPSNIERDIMRHLGLPLPIHWISVPVLSAKDRKTRSELRLPYLMPHELVHYLHAT